MLLISINIPGKNSLPFDLHIRNLHIYVLEYIHLHMISTYAYLSEPVFRVFPLCLDTSSMLEAPR